MPGMMIQKAIHRIRPHDCLDYRFLFYTFLWMGAAGGFTPGRGATREALTEKEVVGSLPIVLPDRTIMDQWTVFARDLGEQRENLDHQNAPTGDARDLLLPRLMSGEIAV